MATSDIISLASAAIALIALSTSLWNAYVTRKHNILSVIPNLIVHHDINEGRLIFTLENNGVGPAIIKKFVLLAGEKELLCTSGEVYDAALDSIGVPLLHERYFPSINEHVSAAKEIVLFKSIAANDPELRPKLELILTNLKFKITYTSIYQSEEFEFIGNA